MRRSSPRKGPPEPCAYIECKHCGRRICDLETENRTEHDDGAVTADLVCPKCGGVIDEGHLVREPNRV